MLKRLILMVILFFAIIFSLLGIRLFVLHESDFESLQLIEVEFVKFTCAGQWRNGIAHLLVSGSNEYWVDLQGKPCANNIPSSGVGNFHLTLTKSNEVVGLIYEGREVLNVQKTKENIRAKKIFFILLMLGLSVGMSYLLYIGRVRKKLKRSGNVSNLD